MKKTAVLFTSILNIDIEDDPFEIEKGLYISNNKSLKYEILENSYEAIGGLEFGSIMNNSVMAYAYVDREINDNNKDELLKDFLFYLDTFIQTLWIIKDNSVYKELGYLKYDNDQKFFSNFIAQINSNCLGKKVFSFYSLNELQNAKRCYEKIKKYAANNSDFEYSNLTSDSNRISRYLYYLNGARLLPDIGFKYALYCTALESLLVTKSGNVTRQLANKIDFMIGNQIENVKSYIYKSYENRSQIFHGNTFKDNDIRKKEKLLNNLQILDEICRLIFQNIFRFDEFEKVLLLSDKEIDDFLMIN